MGLEDNKVFSPSVEEIYTRQNDGCFLELEVDKINGKLVFGDIFCSNGVSRFATSTLLNPSADCIKCMIKFIQHLFEKYEFVEIDGQETSKNIP